MKTKNILSFAVLGLLGLSACNNEEELAAGWQDNPEAVKFEASIQKISTTRTNPSDDTQSGNFNTNDQLTISAGSQSAVYKKGDNGEWIPVDAQKFITWTAPEMTISAQHPVADVTNGFTVPTDQSTVSNMAAADYMTYSGTHQETKNPIKLSMNRQMARVHVTSITNTDGMTNPTISAITFSSKSVVGGSGTSSSFVDVTPLAVESGYMALLAPVSKADGQPFIKVTVEDQNNGGQTKTFTVKNTPELKAGYSHEFTLKIGAKVELGVVSVSPWTEGTGGDLETNTDLEPIVDAGAHKVTLKEAGTLDAAYLHEAFGSGATGNLAVEGPADAADLQNIADFCKQKGKSVNLNLVGMTGFTALPANSFKDCTALTQITLSSNMTEIGGHAFSNTGLTHFTVPETMTTIGEGILSGCTQLTKVTLAFDKETSVTYNYTNAFQGVGDSGKEVTLFIKPSWKENLTGDESNGYTFLGGKFKTVQEIIKTSAVRFNDAGILAGNTSGPVSSVTYEALVNFTSFDNTDKVNTIIGKEGVLLLRVGDQGIPNNITQLCVAGEKENIQVSSEHGFGANTWYHLAMTYDAQTGNTCIYINGTPVAEKTIGTNKTFDIWSKGNNGVDGLCIGRYKDYKWGKRPFSGMMKEVRVWSVARTAEEIKANMLSIDATQAENLEVYYKLEGNDISADGTTVTNSAVGKPNGTIHKGGSGSLTKVEIDSIVIP